MHTLSYVHTLSQLPHGVTCWWIVMYTLSQLQMLSHVAEIKVSDPKVSELENPAVAISCGVRSVPGVMSSLLACLGVTRFCFY